MSHPDEYKELFDSIDPKAIEGLFLDLYGSRLAADAFLADSFELLIQRLLTRFYPTWLSTKNLLSITYDPLTPNSDTMVTQVHRVINNEGSHNSQDTSSVCGYNDPIPTPADVNSNDTSNTNLQNEDSTTTTTHTSSLTNLAPNEALKSELNFREQRLIDKVFSDILAYVSLAVY